jgi:uncharacterized protein YjbJ (UPF0337 family)
MNELLFKGEWNELKGKLKQKYAQLTDDDLVYAKGKEDELLGRLEKTGPDRCPRWLGHAVHDSSELSDPHMPECGGRIHR